MGHTEVTGPAAPVTSDPRLWRDLTAAAAGAGLDRQAGLRLAAALTGRTPASAADLTVAEARILLGRLSELAEGGAA
jgi:hypothetical protein